MSTIVVVGLTLSVEMYCLLSPNELDRDISNSAVKMVLCSKMLGYRPIYRVK